MNKPLLIAVVGQTATGKTDLALKLAQDLLASGRKKVVLLSADSKQVFQGLEILTGADIPDDFQPVSNARSPYPYFQNNARTIELHGIACVSGNEEWSVAHFQKLFRKLIENLHGSAALIVVGGTGLYHQQIFEPAATTAITPNLTLKKKLEQLSLKELQQRLQKQAAVRWRQMNHSDQLNPRRLIRAIEVAQTKQPIRRAAPQQPTLQIGLQLPIKTLQAKIAERVELRIERGVMAEVQQFQMHHPSEKLQAKETLGYQEVRQYLDGKLTLEELKEAWILAEIQYAKRQQTWWKKRSNIKWFAADKIDFSTLKHYNST